MKIVDSVIYNGESKMLDFRLNELNDVVDLFNVVEGKYTFQGNEKEIKFKISEFEKFKDKIIFSIIDNKPDNNPKVNINKSREFLSNKVKNLNLNNEDIILLSDIDEIPDTDILKDIKNNNKLPKEFTFLQNYYYYNIKTKCNHKWKGTAVITYQMLLEKYNSFDNLREAKNNFDLIEKGWHFSYFGNVEFIINKIKSFDHPEFNNERYLNKENIQKIICEGGDIFFGDFGRSERFEIVNETYLPKKINILLSNE